MNRHTVILKDNHYNFSYYSRWNLYLMDTLGHPGVPNSERNPYLQSYLAQM